MIEIILYMLGFLVVSIGFVAFFGAPYVPTLKSQLPDIFELYPFKKEDVFVDIGSGDGVVLRAVAKKGVKAAIGYELSPWLFVVSKFLSRKEGNIKIYFGNFWKKELPRETTVVYTFLNGRYMAKLQKRLQDHVNTTDTSLYFLSYGFKMENQKLIRQQGAMWLYRFDPLQS